MTKVEAGGKSNRVRRENLAQYMDLAVSDTRIVAFSIHPDEIMATFYTYLEGSTSPTSESWPLYVREDLNVPNWKVGSHVNIGNYNHKAPCPTGKCQCYIQSSMQIKTV